MPPVASLSRSASEKACFPIPTTSRSCLRRSFATTSPISGRMLWRLLTDSECWFRSHVVELLEEIATPAALPALRERLAHARPEVRQAAKRAIEKIGRNE